MSYIEPLLPLFFLMTAIGLVRLRPQNNRRSRLLVCGLLGLFLVSWRPVAWLVAQPFETRYQRTAFPADDARVIVVLSSNVLSPVPERPTPVASGETYERCHYAAWLHRNWHRLPILACGGVGADGGQAYSVTMRAVLQGEGVPDSIIWTEEKSRSTHENAHYSAEILRRKGIGKIALVTEASDMLRAEKCFRKEGLQVVPAPCNFRAGLQLEDLLPSWKAIYENERILHETGGLVWYWIHGWI